MMGLGEVEFAGLHHRIGDLEIAFGQTYVGQGLHHRIGDLENALDYFYCPYWLHHRIGDLEKLRFLFL